MSLNRPILDDRTYDQLRDELISRIPVYAPEWSDHNASDPGIALLELFAFLGENILYRFNQIPEATQVEFLRLLQIPLRSAKPANALVTFTTKEMDGVRVPKASMLKSGDVKFESLNEVNVLPVTAFAVGKIAEEVPESGTEEARFFEQSYQTLGLESSDTTAPYHSKVLWQEEANVPVNFDESVDGSLWVAVLAEKSDKVASVRSALATHDDAPLLLNVGFVPDIRIDREEDTTSPEFAQRFRCPGNSSSVDSGPAVEWQIWSDIADDFTAKYRSLSIAGDTTAGLSQEGVVRLRLPKDIDQIGVFDIDDLDAEGTGELPPPLDDEYQDRLVCWLRAFRHDGSRFGSVIYVGANAIQVEQTITAKAEFLGTGNGQANQTYPLVNSQVIADSVVLEVEELSGWQAWQAVDDFFASNEGDRHFMVDTATGNIKFGNGLQSLAPQIGQRIRVKEYRYGGGIAGNVAAESISKVSPNQLVKLQNPLPAYGGAEAETVVEALDRIPAELRRRDRAVTESDFKELALMTPGANIVRAECLPRYHPSLPNKESAGVVSVIVWPQSDAENPEAPMPDLNQLRTVCSFLDARRLITTELYVLPPKYRSISVSVGVVVKSGYGVDAVRHWVELVIRQFLAPVPPYGPAGEGWPLGRRVHGAELEAAAHQVEGVEYLEGLSLAAWDDDGNIIRNTVTLEKNEVPELIGVTVEVGAITIDPADAINSNGVISPQQPAVPPVPVPVIREEC